MGPINFMRHAVQTSPEFEAQNDLLKSKHRSRPNDLEITPSNCLVAIHVPPFHQSLEEP